MRVSSLDGLRGFAVILVMIFHTFLPYTQGGFIGVDIFFVLSGFLITTLFLKEYDSYQTLNLKYFYMRRLLRLTPALLVLVVVFFVYSQFFMSASDKESAPFAVLGALLNFNNLAKAYGWYKLSALGHTWSLSIEEQFYLVWPVMFLLLSFLFRNRKSIAVTLVIIILLLWVNRTLLALSDVSIERLYNGSDTHSDGLFIGCLTALLISLHCDKFRNFTAFLEKYRMSIPLLSILFYVLATFLFGIGIRAVYIWFLPLLNVISAMLIAYLYCNGNTINTFIFSNRYFIWLGSISYGVYLWHWFIYRVVMGFDISGIYVGLIGIPVTIAIASLSFYFLEKPVLKFKKNFY